MISTIERVWWIFEMFLTLNTARFIVLRVKRLTFTKSSHWTFASFDRVRTVHIVATSIAQQNRRLTHWQWRQWCHHLKKKRTNTCVKWTLVKFYLEFFFIWIKKKTVIHGIYLVDERSWIWTHSVTSLGCFFFIMKFLIQTWIQIKEFNWASSPIRIVHAYCFSSTK